MVITPATAARLPDGGRFVALDSLRGIAAIIVTIYHIEGGGILFDSAFFRRGYLFIDFFFVLSGFVIAGAYKDRLLAGFSVRRFIFLRLGRLYPLHLFVLAIYLALELAFLALQPEGWALREPFTGERDPYCLLLSIFMIHAFLEPYPNMWSPQSWSIAVEVWLYLGAALIWHRLKGSVSILVFCLGVTVAIWLLNAGSIPWTTPLSRKMIEGVAGFGLGVLCWQLWSQGLKSISSAPKGALTVLEVAIVGLIYVVVSKPDIAFGAMNFVFAAAVLVFAAEKGALSRLLSRSLFVWLGTLSYSIYMIHGFVIGRSSDALRMVGMGKIIMIDGVGHRQIDAGPWISTFIVLAMVAASVFLAYFTWRFVEAPARKWSRNLAANMGAAGEERAAPTI